MDYYGFAPEAYELKFSSRGDAQLSQRVVELFNQVSYSTFPPFAGPLFFI
jgi:aromatic ring-opening dioxygenase catalytic subunit (LigB family)